jgi:hypothetical protein
MTCTEGLKQRVTCVVTCRDLLSLSCVHFQLHMAEIAPMKLQTLFPCISANTQVEAQAQELAAAKEASATAQQLVASQQLMILDQHNKLRLQEEVSRAWVVLGIGLCFVNGIVVGGSICSVRTGICTHTHQVKGGRRSG